MLELVGVVLENPELRGRLLLHVLGRAVHRLVGPRVVGPGRPLEVVAPLPALAPGPSSASEAARACLYIFPALRQLETPAQPGYKRRARLVRIKGWVVLGWSSACFL